MGNPHILGHIGVCKLCGVKHKRGEAVEAFRKDFHADNARGARLRGLAAKLDINAVLGCWCAPYACHCDIIAEYRNSLLEVPF